MDKKEELLKKIKALAERGVGNEKDNASKILKSLMDKYGITDAEINDERVDYHWFKYGTTMEERLINQIIYMVTGQQNLYTHKLLKKHTGTKCTVAQSIEIDACASFYKAKLKEDLEVFLRAFVHKNNIFPPDAPQSFATEEIDLDMLKMAQGMTKHEYHKMLPNDSIYTSGTPQIQ